MRDKFRLPDNKVPDCDYHDKKHNADSDNGGTANLCWFVICHATKPHAGYLSPHDSLSLYSQIYLSVIEPTDAMKY